MNRLLSLCAVATLSGLSIPVEAQNSPPVSDTAPVAMPGMTMSSAYHDSAAMGHSGPHAGKTPPPPLPTDHYADRLFPTDMEAARRQMMRESGSQTLSQIQFNIAEIQIHHGRAGYRWDGEGWFGGDINRLVIKSEGSGDFGSKIDEAEVQALYSRAVSPMFNIQAGLRHDFGPHDHRTYAAVGVEGLSPYMMEVGGALFVSDKGDLSARLEGYYDERITQKLILQPRVELNFSAQDVPESRIGRGLTDAEMGLRLRYEITREFAPYVGVSYDVKSGRTADWARGDGERASALSFVVGIRSWF